MSGAMDALKFILRTELLQYVEPPPTPRIDKTSANTKNSCFFDSRMLEVNTRTDVLITRRSWGSNPIPATTKDQLTYVSWSFFALIRHRETDPQCVLVRFHSFLFSRNERREVYGMGIFAKNDGGDACRQTSSCGGMVVKYSVIYRAKVHSISWFNVSLSG